MEEKDTCKELKILKWMGGDMLRNRIRNEFIKEVRGKLPLRQNEEETY